MVTFSILAVRQWLCLFLPETVEIGYFEFIESTSKNPVYPMLGATTGTEDALFKCGARPHVKTQKGVAYFCCHTT